MSSYEKISISITGDLLTQLDERSRRSDVSRSQTIVDLLTVGLQAEPQIRQLEARVRERESLPKKLIPPHLSADFLTGDRPGTDRLKQKLSSLERQLAEAHANSFRAQAWADSHERAAKVAREDVARLDRELSQGRENDIRLEQALGLERARRIPWHISLPIPIMQPRVFRPAVESPHWRSFLKGVGTTVFAGFLALLLVPYKTGAMRAFATAAMGTWGDIPAAAARLHGGPIAGQETLLQIYALMHAGRNPERWMPVFLDPGSSRLPTTC